MKTLFGSGMACLVLLIGCDNRPTLDRRGNIVLCGSRFRGPNCEGNLTASGDVDVGGTVNAPNGGTFGGIGTDDEGNVVITGNLEVEGDVGVGGTVTVGEGDDQVVIPPAPPVALPPVNPPPPPDDEEPALLTATLTSNNGEDHFKVGDDIRLTVQAVGGKGPYDFRCLWVEGDIIALNDSDVPTFSFKKWEQRFKIVRSPGSGTVNCKVTSADGQSANTFFVVYVD